MAERAQIGIIGLGAQGQNHLAVLSEDKRAQIVAVCDPVKSLPEAAGKRYTANAHTDFRRMIEEEHLDAVFVAAPNAFHMEMLEFAIEHNLGIFCEKPMVITLQDAEKVSQLVHQKGIKFQMGHNRRLQNPPFSNLHACLSLGKLIDTMACGLDRASRLSGAFASLYRRLGLPLLLALTSSFERAPPRCGRWLNIVALEKPALGHFSLLG